MKRLAPVDPADPAALSAWLASLRALLGTLRDLESDAAAPKGHRMRCRGALRDAFRRHHRNVGAHLDAIDPGITPSAVDGDAPAGETGTAARSIGDAA